MGFNVTKDKKLTGVVLDSKLQLTFKQLSLAEFWYPQLFKKAIKISFYFPTLYLCEVQFSSHPSAKTCERLDSGTIQSPYSFCYTRPQGYLQKCKTMLPFSLKICHFVKYILQKCINYVNI